LPKTNKFPKTTSLPKTTTDRIEETATTSGIRGNAGNGARNLMIGNGGVREATSGIKGGAGTGTWSATVGDGGAIETTGATETTGNIKRHASTGIRTLAAGDLEAKA
jgi:hypothetical protein